MKGLTGNGLPPPVGSESDRDLTEFTYLLVTVHVYIGMAQHSSILRTNKYDAIDIHIFTITISYYCSSFS